MGRAGRQEGEGGGDWGPAGELRWSRWKMAVRMEVRHEKAGGRKGGNSGAGSRAGSQVKSGCTRRSPPPPPGPKGPPTTPSPLAGGSCRRPIFCLLPLGIRFILWRGKELG